MNRTEIPWENKEAGWKLKFTWNPLYGCIRKCYYCYARAGHDKWHQQYLKGKVQNFAQYSKTFEELQVFEKRFQQPGGESSPAVIFVCDMGDICFHSAVDVQRVIDVVCGCPQHVFLFLTQDYTFYNKFRWPDNAWLGITMVFGRLKNQPGYKSFVDLRHRHKFMSIEPIMGLFDMVDLSYLQWVIVGGMNHVKGDDYIQPKKEWVKSVKHRNIYYKDLLCRSLSMQD